MQDQETAAPKIDDEQAEILDKLADQTGNDPGDQDESDGEKKFTQDDVDRFIADRLAREKAKREKDTTKAREEAEAKALEEQQEYQELATKRQQRIETLEAEVDRLSAVEEKATKYEGALTQHLETRMEGIPAGIQSLLKDRDPVDQMAWLTENQPELTQDMPGSPPAGDPSELTAEQLKVHQVAAARQVRNMF